MDLTSAIKRLKQSSEPPVTGEIIPWESRDEGVRSVWRRITSPENLSTLKEWLGVDSRNEYQHWTQQAIEECEQRQSEIGNS